MPTTRTLILAWGNPARGDDGLGPAIAGLVDALAIPEVTVHSDYQLQIEDAETIARHDRVIFVDADRTGTEPFSCRRLTPSTHGLSFTSHSVSPGALLELTRRLFERAPEAWLIGIRSYDFDQFEEKLSAGARTNLEAAADFMRRALTDGELAEVRAATSGPIARRDESNAAEAAEVAT